MVTLNQSAAYPMRMKLAMQISVIEETIVKKYVTIADLS
jgi:hypothetical protein